MESDEIWVNFDKIGDEIGYTVYRILWVSINLGQNYHQLGVKLR